MTLHWWMHWFWITRLGVVLSALLLVTPATAAPYSSSVQHEVHGQLDDSTITEVESTAYNTDFWISTQDLSTASSIEEPGMSSVVLWPSDTTGSTISTVSESDVLRKDVVDPYSKVVTEPSTRTYLPFETEQIGLSGDVTPFIFYRSSSDDSTSASDSHMFLHSTITEEHVFPSVSDADNLHVQDTQVVGKLSVVSEGEENVPVKNSTFISEPNSVNQNFSGTEDSIVSIKDISKSSAADDNSSIEIPTEDLGMKSQLLFNSSKSTSSGGGNISPDPMIDTLNSHSQGMDKPSVNIPRLITRDLKNNSQEKVNTSSPISILASQTHDQGYPDHSSLPPSILPPLTPQNSRAGKVAGYFPPQAFHLHSFVLSTISPSKDEPEAFPFPPNRDTSDVIHGFMQDYKQGPKSSEEFLNPRNAEVAIKDPIASEHEDSESKIIWITGSSSISGSAPELGKVIPVAGAESIPLEDVEMRDSPYNPQESSTITDSKSRPLADDVSKHLPISSSDLVLPTDKAIGETDTKPSDSDHLPTEPREKGRGKEILKVIPPMMASSKVVNASSQGGRSSDNGTKSSFVPPIVSENTGGNTSIGTVSDDENNSSTVVNTSGGLPADTKSSVLTVPSSVPVVKQVANVTPAAKDVDENETTVVTVFSTVVPVSNGRVAAAAAPSGPHHGLDAASITGISLGILVFAALVGAVSFVLYRRRFLNKPQTLNDKCSNPDSSGYIDDSTLRENSEEMYSLDNDSFLNSLEAMTIQNYWTDNVKHTKL